MSNIAVRLTPVKRRAEREQEQALEAILTGVWSLKLGAEPINVSNPSPYIDHYRQIRAIVNSSQLRFTRREEIIELLALIKTHHVQPLRIIKHELKASRPKWMVQQDDEATVTKAIDIALRLWLMIEPQGGLKVLHDNLSIREIVSQSFEKSHIPTGATSIKELSFDFSARNLYRKGGIKILWTSCLCHHLLMDGKNKLRVFHYASLLRRYREANALEKCAVPPLFASKFPLPAKLTTGAQRPLSRRCSQRDRRDSGLAVSHCRPRW
jgi:hypothetical protein